MAELIYLAFGNVETPRIEVLDEELVELSSGLNSAYLNSDVKVVVNPCATLENVIIDIRYYKDHLSAFHCSGVYNQKDQSFDDLMEALNECNLVFVLLNVDIERSKVEKFLEWQNAANKAPAIIGKSKRSKQGFSAIDKLFSVSVWEKLCGFRGTKKGKFLTAYNTAKGEVETKSDEDSCYLNCGSNKLFNNYLDFK